MWTCMCVGLFVWLFVSASVSVCADGNHDGNGPKPSSCDSAPLVHLPFSHVYCRGSFRFAWTCHMAYCDCSLRRSTGALLSRCLRSSPEKLCNCPTSYRMLSAMLRANWMTKIDAELPPAVRWRSCRRPQATSSPQISLRLTLGRCPC